MTSIVQCSEQTNGGSDQSTDRGDLLADWRPDHLASTQRGELTVRSVGGGRRTIRPGSFESRRVLPGNERVQQWAVRVVKSGLIETVLNREQSRSVSLVDVCSDRMRAPSPPDHQALTETGMLRSNEATSQL